MNAAKRLKQNKIDITVDKNAIYSNLFYGYDAPAASLPNRIWAGVKRGAAAVGRVVALPFLWIGKAALYFVLPRDPRSMNQSDNLMEETRVPYYRPPMVSKRSAPAPLEPDVYLAAASAAPQAKSRMNQKPRREKVRFQEESTRQAAVMDVPLTEILPILVGADGSAVQQAGAVEVPATFDMDGIIEELPLEPEQTTGMNKKQKRGVPGQSVAVPKDAAGAIPRAKYRMGRGKRIAIGLIAACILGGAGFGAWYYFEGRYCVVTVYDDGAPVQLRTAEATVGDILSENGLSLRDQDLIDCPTEEQPYEGLVINITRAKNITIKAGGKEQVIRLAKGTVEDALHKAGVAHKEGDEITPALSTAITEDMDIRVVDVDVEYRTRTESVPFQTVYKESATLLKGKTTVSQQGKNGVRTIETRITYRDGEVSKTEVVSNRITTQPVNKVVLQGTKAASKTTKPASTGSTGASTGAYGNYVTGYTAPTSAMIARQVTIKKVTAYTHTGARTATGKWPKVGMCAVDPKMFPYGTRLFIPGYGYAVAEDTGGFVKSGIPQIDLFMNTETECRRWGVKRNVTVYVIK